MSDQPADPFYGADHPEPWSPPLVESELRAQMSDLLHRQEAARRLRSLESAAVEVPEPVTGDVFLAEPDDPVPWVIDRLAKAGTVVLLTAGRKVGKTTFVSNLVLCLCDGTDFLGEYPVHFPDGQAGVIDCELPRDTSRAWWRAVAMANPKRLTYWNLRGRASAFNILDDTGRALWAARLRESGVRVLVVDCAGPVIKALGLDEDKQAGHLVEALQALQADAGLVLVILVHHHGWSGARGRGDSKLEDWSDDIWRLGLQVPEDFGSAREFSTIGRHSAVPKTVLSHDPAAHRLAADEDAVPSGFTIGAEQRVLAAITLIRGVYLNMPVPAASGPHGVWARLRDDPRRKLQHITKANIEAAVARIRLSDDLRRTAPPGTYPGQDDDPG